MPIDGRVSLDFDIAMHLGLARQPHIFVRVAEQFESEQWVDPLVDSLKDPFFAAVFPTNLNSHIAATACTIAHAVHELVGAGIQLNAVFASNCSDVFTVLSFDGELFVDKLNCRHNEFALGIWKRQENVAFTM